MSDELKKSIYLNDRPFVVRREDQNDMDLHEHNFMELVVVVSGTGFHRTCSDNYILKIGDIFAVPPGMKHGYFGCENLKLINLLFSEEDFIRIFPELLEVESYRALFHLEPQMRDIHNFTNRLFLKSDKLKCIVSDIEKIESVQNSRNVSSVISSKCRFIDLLLNICREYSNNGSDGTRILLGLGRVISYIESNLTNEIKIDDLCGIAGMSRATLFRRFKNTMGVSPLQYHNESRMMKAEKLLKGTDLAVKEIAFESGFDDPNHFSRRFRQSRGVSPGSFRKNGSTPGEDLFTDV